MKSSPKRFRTLSQESRYSSPWSVRVRIALLLWQIVWTVLFRPTPKILSAWRVSLLKLFGCRASGIPHVSASAIIKMPWNLTLEDRACLGPDSEVYNLGHVTLRAGSTVAQQAYLCTGSHDFTHPHMPLIVGDIEIGHDAFIGARAFVLPGIAIGKGAVIGACAVVTKSVDSYTVVAGNPASIIGTIHSSDAKGEVHG